MGMSAVFVSVSDEKIDLIQNTPALIGNVVYPDEPNFFFDLESMRKPKGFFAKIFGKSKDIETEPPRPEPLVLSGSEGAEVDVDKAWHGIHYCMTRDIGEGDHPLGFILYGGTLAGDLDVGYGPARLFTAEQTAKIAGDISHVTSQSLRENYNPADMKDVYPADLWSGKLEDSFDYFDYIVENFDILKAFLKDCKKNKVGFLTYIC